MTRKKKTSRMAHGVVDNDALSSLINEHDMKPRHDLTLGEGCSCFVEESSRSCVNLIGLSFQDKETANKSDIIRRSDVTKVTPVPILRFRLVENDEVWHFYSGGALLLLEILGNDAETIRFTAIGPVAERGNKLNHLVRSGTLLACALLSSEDDSFTLVGYGGKHCESVRNLSNAIPKTPGILSAESEFFELYHRDSDDVSAATKAAISERIKSVRSLADAEKVAVSDANPQSHPPFRSTPFENPRQIITSLLVISFLLPLALYRDTSNSTIEDDIRMAILAVFLGFVTFAFLQTRDLILTTPHPGFWRVIFGIVSFYTLFMLSLLMLSKETARNLIHTVYGDIGTLEDFESGIQARIDDVMGTCAFTYSALIRQLFHCPWFMGHLLGWAGKMLFFRDYYLALFAAVLFEICEVTFTYVVPEFEECWWDSLFLDTLGANLLGMFLGNQINKFITSNQKMHPNSHMDVGASFNWGGKQPRAPGSTSQLLSLISPFSTQYEWKIFSSPTRLFQVVAVAFFMVLVEVNQFLIINSFGVPNSSYFVTFRLMFVALLAIPAGSEWYSYVVEYEKAKGKIGIRIGPSIWILFCMVMVEIAVCIKFFPHHMTAELEKVGPTRIPHHILLSHLIAAALLSIWVLLKYKFIGYTNIELSTRDEKDVAKKLICDKYKSTNSDKHEKEKQLNFWMLPNSLKKKVVMVEAVDALLLLACLPMFYLFYAGWKWT